MLNKEAHVPYIAYINTLAGYVHKRLTDRFEVGVGEASGIFPVEGIGYKKEYLEPTEKSLAEKGFDHKLKDILPAVRNAGEKGAVLTEEGAKLTLRDALKQACRSARLRVTQAQAWWQRTAF